MQQQATEKVHLLMDWLQTEWPLFNPNTSIYQFQPIKHTHFLFYLLTKIDHKYFQEIQSIQYSFHHYFIIIEKYFQECHGKKFKRTYRKEILQKQPLTELIKLVIFLLIQSEEKQEYINRIFALKMETQNYLMEEFKKISLNLQNSIEIQEILETVVSFQEENELINCEMLRLQGENAKMTALIKEISFEKEQIKVQSMNYLAEKHAVLRQLNLVNLSEYVDLYSNLKHQNHCIEKGVFESIIKKEEIDEESKILKEHLVEDRQQILKLNDQVALEKQNYFQIKDERCLFGSSNSQWKLLNQSSILQQNRSFENKGQKRSLETSCTGVKNSFISSQAFLDNEDYEENQGNSNMKIKLYNRELMAKVQVMSKQIQQVTGYIAELKEEKRVLKKKYKGKDRKINQLKKLHDDFMREVRSMK